MAAPAPPVNPVLYVPTLHRWMTWRQFKYYFGWIRPLRGARICENGGVIPDPNNGSLYLVYSQRYPAKVYPVFLDPSRNPQSSILVRGAGTVAPQGAEFCACDDFYDGNRCKHIYAALFFERQQTFGLLCANPG